MRVLLGILLSVNASARAANKDAAETCRRALSLVTGSVLALGDRFGGSYDEARRTAEDASLRHLIRDVFPEAAVTREADPGLNLNLETDGAAQFFRDVLRSPELHDLPAGTVDCFVQLVRSLGRIQEWSLYYAGETRTFHGIIAGGGSVNIRVGRKPARASYARAERLGRRGFVKASVVTRFLDRTLRLWPALDVVVRAPSVAEFRVSFVGPNATVYYDGRLP